jgi:hypothetical protein
MTSEVLYAIFSNREPIGKLLFFFASFFLPVCILPGEESLIRFHSYAERDMSGDYLQRDVELITDEARYQPGVIRLGLFPYQMEDGVGYED